MLIIILNFKSKDEQSKIIQIILELNEGMTMVKNITCSDSLAEAMVNLSLLSLLW